MELVEAGAREAPVVTQIITYKQAAEVLGISDRTFVKLIDRGDIPVIEIGARGRRVWLSDVVEYLERQTKRRTKAQ